MAISFLFSSNYGDYGPFFPKETLGKICTTFSIFKIFIIIFFGVAKKKDAGQNILTKYDDFGIFFLKIWQL